MTSPSQSADSPPGAQLSYRGAGVTRALTAVRPAPRGHRTRVVRARIGDGAERWEFASHEVLRWGVKTRSGFRVHDAAASTERRAVTGPVRVGDEVIIRAGIGPFSIREPVRVVYVVDTPTTRGFGYGTLPGHPLRGEEAFLVERADDGSVWLSIRSISRPAGFLWWCVAPGLRLAAAIVVRRYRVALAGPLRTAPLPAQDLAGSAA